MLFGYGALVPVAEAVCCVVDTPVVYDDWIVAAVGLGFAMDVSEATCVAPVLTA